MHLHEEPLSGPEAVFPQRRVTPEELTRALAVIEARKQEVARQQEAERAYLEKTIPVDEAVRELNLEATPQEIWAEVEAQRAAEPEQIPPPNSNWSTETVPNTSVLAPPHSHPAPLATSNLGLWSSRRRVVGLLLAAGLIGSAALLSQRHPLSHLASTPTAQAAAPLNVSNYPDAIPFELTADSVERVLRGEDTSKIAVDPNANYDPNTNWGWWSLIKYDGHVYLRGWMAAPPAVDALRGRTVEISNVTVAPENGDRPAEITLRVDTLKYRSFFERLDTFEPVRRPPNMSALRGDKIVVSDVHLDQHAWERAKYVMSTKGPTIIPLPVSSQDKERIIKDQQERNKLRLVRLPKPGGTSIADLPNEEPFLLRDLQLSYLLTGAPATAVSVAARRTSLDHPENSASWLVVKHGGDLYLRGWVSGNLRDDDHTVPLLHLYNSPSLPELDGAAKPISLRLGNLRHGPYGCFYAKRSYFGMGRSPEDTSSAEQAVFTDVHLDEHANEKWQP